MRRLWGRRPAWGCGHSPAVAAPPRPWPRGPLALQPEVRAPCQRWPCWASRLCWAGRSCGGRARGPKVCRVREAGPGYSCAWPGGWVGAALQCSLPEEHWGSKRRSPGPAVGVSGRARVGGLVGLAEPLGATSVSARTAHAARPRVSLLGSSGRCLTPSAPSLRCAHPGPPWPRANSRPFSAQPPGCPG